MTYPHLLPEISGKIAVVEIDNPPANSLSGELLMNLDNCIKELNQDKNVKIIIITGKGRLFACGADINEMGRCKTSIQAKEMSQLGQKVFLNKKEKGKAGGKGKLSESSRVKEFKIFFNSKTLQL